MEDVPLAGVKEIESVGVLLRCCKGCVKVAACKSSRDLVRGDCGEVYSRDSGTLSVFVYTTRGIGIIFSLFGGLNVGVGYVTIRGYVRRGRRCRGAIGVGRTGSVIGLV